MGKFYLCEHCKNLIEKIDDKGVPVVCCGQPMKELMLNTAEASGEKHLPDIYAQGGTVTVQIGTVPHPMIQEHLIEWVQLETDRGIQRKRLKAGDEPVVTFYIGDEKPIAAYAYCNIHGLWKAMSEIS